MVFLKFLKCSLVIFLYFLVSFSTTISSELKVAVDSSVAVVNDTVCVRFLVNDIYDLFAAGFDLEYNPNQLEYVRATEGTFLNSNGTKNTIFVVSNDSTKGKIITGITRSNYLDGGASSVGDTTLLSVYFRITVADSIPLIITRSSLIAPDGVTKYPHTVTNGYILSRDPSYVIDWEGSVPKTFSIEIGYNYPNPFNSVTSIDCQVFSKQQGEIYIVNLLGQRLKTIFRGMLYPGDYSFTWNARDKDNNTMPSGIYCFIFHFENFRQSRKAIYLK